jgi:hypothetical protein
MTNSQPENRSLGVGEHEARGASAPAIARSPVRREPNEGKSQPRIELILKSIHDRNAAAPIMLPDECDAFPASSRARIGLGSSGVEPVAVDANRLRHDVLYACRNNRRTVLVNAANMGAIRLFCASHVVEEVAEHAQRWAKESKDVSYATFRAWWTAEYVPVIREVRDQDLVRSLLDPVEIKRIEELQATDRDDVPSAILALVLGAFFLSEDGPAVRAVYGPDVDLADHRAWVEVLKAGGDAAALSELVFGATMAPAALGRGTVYLGQRLAGTFSPWVFLPIGIAAAVLGKRISPERWTKMRSGLFDAAMAYADMYSRYMSAVKRFRAATPSVPTWTELAESNDRRSVLARTCLHTLARAPASHMSARELARVLPELDVGQGEQLVRETLRSYRCFDQPYEGRWQVGQATTTQWSS